jgi:hypothetical protein
MQTKISQRESSQTERRAVQKQSASTVQRKSDPLGNAGVLLSLQRSHGNRYVQRLLDIALLQRAVGGVGTCPVCENDAQAEQSDRPSLQQKSAKLPAFIQAKLTVSQPGDPYEQEADRVAEEVMRMPEPGAAESERASVQTQAPAIRPVFRSLAAQIQREDVIDYPVPEDLQEKIQAKQDSGSEHAVPSELEARLGSSRGFGQPLSQDVRAFMDPRFNYDFSSVRVHTDGKAAQLARDLSARAFTVGNDIYFAAGQYAQHDEGRRLLAHELTHVVQQSGASQAVMRAVSFTTADGPITTNNVVATEDATGFTLRSPEPTFQWQPDVTIHGAAGDVFADWAVAHHQVKKGDWLNVWWGTGADRTHRRETVTGGMPIRDATGAGNTWYSDWRAQGFAADGDVRSPIMRDTPSRRVPWANPIAGRGGTRGWFNLGLGFVSTLSARHIPDGAGAAAFRHLNHVHWNFDVDGTFDTALPVPGRVTLTGGTINTSAVMPGVDAANPPMHGGPLSIANTVDTDT